MFGNTALRTLHTIGLFTCRNGKKPVFANYQYSSSSSLQTKPKTPFTPMELIKKLRGATGAPMVECKKAISAEGVEGDYEKATEWLRKHGSAKAASKLAGRDASEGLVGIAISDTSTDNENCAPANVVGAIVRVTSETDFASRSPAFSSFVKTVADSAITLSRIRSGREKDEDSLSRSDTMDVDEILATSVVGGRSVKDALDDAVLAIRENLQIASVMSIVPSKSDAVLAGYVHGMVDGANLAGTAAAIVELVPTTSSSKKTSTEIHDIGKKLAMHIVAAKPTYLSPDQIPQNVLDKEREILMEQMNDSGKSADIMDKIVSGRLRKFYEQVCLTEQAHMLEEGNPKIIKLMKKLGLQVVRFESNFV